MRLGKDFYSRDTITVAKELLGTVLVHDGGKHRFRGIIVETEAYLGIEDKAAHSYGGKRTKKNEAMYGPPGTAYVYIIYGMYNCLNIVTLKEGIPEAVLIRAVEPIENIEQMALNRFDTPYEELNRYQRTNLTNGPGKLSISFDIDRRLDKEDLSGGILYLEKGDYGDFDIVEAKRIGIDYAEEARDYPYRYYIKNNAYVSKL